MVISGIFRIFVLQNQKKNTAMLITEGKITEIFFMADEFCKFLDKMVKKYTIKKPGKRRYHRDGKMSTAEINEYSRDYDHHDNIPHIWTQVLQTLLYGICVQAYESYVPQNGIIQPNGGAGEIRRTASCIVCQEGTDGEMHRR